MKTFVKHNHGFTLMELMVAMAIFSILMAAAATSKFEQQEDNITQIQAAEMQQNARTVMFMMKQNILMAGFNPTDTDLGEGITTATPTALTFSYLDTDTDTLVTDAYVFDVDDREVTWDGAVLAENVLGMRYTYYDAGRDVTADMDDIRSVDISITTAVDINERARATGNNTRTLTTTVYLRNMGL